MRRDGFGPTAMKNITPAHPPIFPPSLGLPAPAHKRERVEDEAPRAEGDAPEVRTGKPRALVVDDAPDVAEMITILLRHAGYEVETALSARAALEAAGRSRFDVVVSDIGMPEMNGYELAERLRALPEYASVPLVAVTGFSMYDDRERAAASGFDDFLNKPINTGDLLATLERLRS